MKHYTACVRDNIFDNADPVKLECPFCHKQKTVSEPFSILRLKTGALAFCTGKRIKIETPGNEDRRGRVQENRRINTIAARRAGQLT